MSFCTICGTKAFDESAKFCHKCGAPLVIEGKEDKDKDAVNKDAVSIETRVISDNEDEETIADESSVVSIVESEQRGSSAYELGTRHEETVAKILKDMGYSTELRKKLPGKSGNLREIDIIATKAGKGYRNELLVECKNYTSPVSIEKVGYFWSKLQDLGKKNGLFVAEPRFSDEAINYGQERGLLLWDRQYIIENLYYIDIGRSGTKRELSKIRYYLPLNVDYDKATNLSLANKENVVIENIKLIWKPFYKASFKIKCTRIDPRKKKRTIEDSGSLTIDGLSASVIQQSDSIKNAFKKMLGQSEEDSQKIKENDIFLRELEQTPDTGFPSEQSGAYSIEVHPPKENEEQVKKRLINYVLKNQYIEYYKLKKDEGNILADERPFKITPHLKEIKTNIRLIYIPKWEMDFQSKEYVYTRKMTGNSGAILYDTITHCNKHWNVGFGKKQNIAVCDVCGEIACKEHIWKCSTCGSWRCEHHSIKCINCQKMYCPEHIPTKCKECENAVCNSCAVKCILCGEFHCQKHMTKCSKCQKIICVSCTRKEGGILSFGQKVICKNC